MYCSNCGKPVKDGAAICDQCGAPIQESKKENNEQKEYREYNTEEFQQEPEEREPLSKIEVVGLICAFAVVGLIAGIIITACTQSDAGFITVIVSAVVIAVCQIIIWISRKISKE